jgi:FkbM family methyltransferase
MRVAVKSVLMRAGLYHPARQFYRSCHPGVRRRTREEEAFYRIWLRPGMLCFDVGAHLGNKTAVFLHIGAHVVAVEPEPFAATCLQRSFGRDRSFRLVQKAVAASAGTMTLHVRPESLSTTSLRADWGLGRSAPVMVEATTLDGLVHEYGTPDYCKIDVEGYETEVFQGLSRPLPLISFEFFVREMGRALQCMDRLAGLGDYEFNVAPGDQSSLVLQTWVATGGFKEWLQHEWRHGRRGDIYARLVRPDQAAYTDR